LSSVVRRLASGLWLVAGLVVLIGVGWALGAVVHDATASSGVNRLDRSVLDWFVEHRVPWVDPAMQVATTIGSSAFMIPLLLVIGGSYWRRQGTTRPVTLLTLAYVGSYVVSQSIKVLVGRPRPPAAVVIGHYASYAFPSGHATESAAVYLMLAVVLAATMPPGRRKAAVRAAAVLIVTLVGLTRLYLAAHWLTDVVAGWSFGTLWVLLVLTAFPEHPPHARLGSSSIPPGTGRTI